MSSGPGILQSQILNKLAGQDSYTFQRVLLWELAADREEITKTGLLCHGIDTGLIKKSFSENFRRAVSRLAEIKKIEIKDEKLTNLDEALTYFPYHTSQLEIHQLRMQLIPSIKDYINEKDPRRHWYFDIETNQIERMRGTKNFQRSKKIWRELQEKILIILKEGDTSQFDLWLECLVRGRYLFYRKKFKHSEPLTNFYNALSDNESRSAIESKALELLNELIVSTFDRKDWDIGALKSVYYGIADFQKGYSDKLSQELKHYLRDKHMDLITSLPGHEDPPEPKNDKHIAIYHHLFLRRINYSKYLDKLLTRQILKTQRQIRAI
ncbi:hypothetical protein [Desulfatibacillum aliphaticivorans]|uniref:hypothetical protein n=1 Tax=Desulfatibacillum aliphaticivorans TaxID=218208 RepID=UPI00041AE4FA|nr:hypothetical protein [Desulfatibacillum aliphaticivorans]